MTTLRNLVLGLCIGLGLGLFSLSASFVLATMICASLTTCSF